MFVDLSLVTDCLSSCGEVQRSNIAASSVLELERVPRPRSSRKLGKAVSRIVDHMAQDGEAQTVVGDPRARKHEGGESVMLGFG